jgi:hypothetical protein
MQIILYKEQPSNNAKLRLGLKKLFLQTHPWKHKIGQSFWLTNKKQSIFLLGLVETFFYESQIKNAKKVILDVFSCQNFFWGGGLVKITRM